MLQKNEIIQLKITALTSEGDGVGRVGDMVFFVPNTAAGDTVSARVLKLKKNVGYARVEEVTVPSADRVEPDCAVSRSCGGCVYRHISYEAELRAKQQKVTDAITRIGKLSADLVQDIIPSKNIDAYRNKAMIPFGLDKNGEVQMGFYARHSHNIMHCVQCRLSPDIFNLIAADVYRFVSKCPTLVSMPQSRRGIRHLYLRYAEATGEVMVCTVLGSSDYEDFLPLFHSLKEKYDCIKTIVVNVNPGETNVVLGERNIVVTGEGSITDILCGLRFSISPHSFYQVNRTGAERLYTLARRYAALNPDDVLLDLYCGTGTIGLSMAQDCCSVIGAEIIPQAIENAHRNAADNGITNARFLCADAAAAAAQLAQDGINPDVIVVDPPRKGLSPELIDTIADMSPRTVVYVSCDPATLARDLSMFSQKNYSVEEITPVDMFPRTAHVETVVLLSRKMPDDKIEVDLDLDELDLTSAESKATYQEIKDYVLKEYGFKVSTLYISQVKRKCGIIERENYNHSRKENPHIPQCPKDKEDAIRAALEHFAMI